MSTPTPSREKQMLKVIFIGDSGVGKTSLQKRYVNNRFTTHYTCTIGPDFHIRSITVGKVEVVLQIWDTAGAEKFMSLPPSYYRGTNCCILVFDICNSDSFEHLNSWKEEFMTRSNIEDSFNFPFAVIGNKADIAQNRQVSKEKAEKWSKENGMVYFESSAKDAINVDPPLLHVATLGLAKLQNPSQTVEIDQPVASNSYASYCCNIM